MKKIKDNLLVLDIETWGSDTDKAILKWFGAYSYRTNKTYFYRYDNIEDIKRLVYDHDFIVGFNQIGFDNPILQRYDVSFRNKINIDLWKILVPKSMGGKGRNIVMRTNFPDNKLSTILKVFGLGRKKQEDFNYGILEKNTWNKAEEAYIINYLRRDIMVTKDLFEYLYNYFYPFKELLTEKDQKNYSWLTTTIGSFSYKVICKEAGLEEIYSEVEAGSREIQYEGAYVLVPTKEKAVATK